MKKGTNIAEKLIESISFYDIQPTAYGERGAFVRSFIPGEAATVNQGITNMETHSCIHFACHARQNTQEPLKSELMLHDGGLELSEIIKKQLVGADLAYLSACQTSTGDEKLSEEAVHLAAGMLAGLSLIDMGLKLRKISMPDSYPKTWNWARNGREVCALTVPRMRFIILRRSSENSSVTQRLIGFPMCILVCNSVIC